MQPVQNDTQHSEEANDSVEAATDQKQPEPLQTEVSNQALSKFNNFGIRKRVNFKLNTDQECIEEEVEAVAMRKVFRKTRKKRLSHGLRNYHSFDKNTQIKNVVYNGTFPIDYPLKSRFDGFGSNYSEEEAASEAEALQTMSLQELVEDRSFNMAKMRKEFQASLTEFEKFLAKGTPSRFVPTFLIDEPL